MSLDIERRTDSERITFPKISLLRAFGIERTKLNWLLQLVGPFVSQNYKRSYGALNMSRLEQILDWHLISYGPFLIPACLEYLGKGNPELRVKLISEGLSSSPRCDLGCLLFFLRPFPGITAKVIKRAERTVDKAIFQAIARVKKIEGFFGQFDNPREQFIDELTWLYSEVQSYTQEGDSKEEALGIIAYNFNSRIGRYRGNLPLIIGFLKLFGLRQKIPDTIRYAAPEILEIASDFLIKYDRRVSELSGVNSNDLFYDIKRDLAGRWKLEHLRKALPEILEIVYNFVPQEGSFVGETIAKLARYMVERHSQGMRLSQIEESISL